MKMQLAALTLTVLATACGTAKSGSETESVTGSATGSKKLTKGSYLVTVSELSSCRAGELSLSKKLTYSQKTANKLENIAIVSSGLVADNLIRPQNCRLGQMSTGTILIETDSDVTLTSEKGSIDAIKAVKVPAMIALTADKLPEGQMVVSYERLDGCNGGAEFIPKKQYNYPGSDVTKPGSVILSFQGVVIDKLIRPTICRSGPQQGRMVLNNAKEIGLTYKDGIKVTGYSLVK